MTTTDPPPQGGRGKEPPPVNSPVPQEQPVPLAPQWGVNRIYEEQEKLPKRPGTIGGFIRGRVVIP